jgi:hypothetical protein
MCIVHTPFSILRKPQKMATWQRERPSILDSLYLLQESNLPQPWNLLPMNKEERDRNGLKERDV